MLKVQGVCDGLESKPHGGKRLPFSPRVYRGLEGWRGMARVSNRGMARVNKGMARQINLKNRDKGIQKTKNSLLTPLVIIITTNETVEEVIKDIIEAKITPYVILEILILFLTIKLNLIHLQKQST